jgi:hypothetical protein
MINLYKSIFNIREQTEEWYGKPNHNSEWDDETMKLDFTPTLTNKHRLTRTRTWLQFITKYTSSDSGKIKKSTIWVTEEKIIRYNFYGGLQHDVTINYYKHLCGTRTILTAEEFKNFLDAANVLLKDLQVRNPVFDSFDSRTWCQCQHTYWNDALGFGGKGCGGRPENENLDDAFYAGTQQDKEAVQNALYKCGYGVSEFHQRSPAIKVKSPVNKWGDYGGKRGCKGCDPPVELLLNNRDEPYIKTIVRPNEISAEAFKREIDSISEAESLLLNPDNTYCFPPQHHYDPDDEDLWSGPEPDFSSPPDPESPYTNPHDLISHGCKCEDWNCPDKRDLTLKNFVVDEDGLVFRHVGEGESNPYHLLGTYELTHVSGRVINEFEKGFCFSNSTKPYPPDQTNSYYFKQYNEENPQYEHYFLDRHGCNPVVSSSNFGSIPVTAPITMVDAHNFTWCSDVETSYTDSGLVDLKDCEGTELRPGYKIETFIYLGENYHIQFKSGRITGQYHLISDPTELLKLGLEETITSDSGVEVYTKSTLDSHEDTSGSDTNEDHSDHSDHSDDASEGSESGSSSETDQESSEIIENEHLYSFSVFYVVTDVYGNQETTGKNIKVIKNCNIN